MREMDRSGGVGESAHNPDLLAFEHEGRLVLNPYLSACGRYAVDPRVHYGFRPVRTETGWALQREHPAGGSLLLVTEDGCAIPDVELWHEARIVRNDGQGALSWAMLRDVAGGPQLEVGMDFVVTRGAGPA